MSAPEQMTRRKVLVTGASGFIGSHLCQRLAVEGALVHEVTRSGNSTAYHIVESWQRDLADVNAVREIFAAVRPELVFHLASHVTGSRELAKVLPTFYSNLATTVHVLTAAAEMKCQRVVLASSSEEPVTADAFACSPYAMAKWAGTGYARMFHELFRVPVVCPRIFMTYGPDQKDHTKIIPYTILSLLRNESPELTSGRRLADWIFVDDVVEGLVRAATTPGIEGLTFDLGTGKLSSVYDVVSTIRKIMAVDTAIRFGSVPERPFEQERPADIEFMNQRFGWAPQIDLNAGLRKTLDWYRQRGPGQSVEAVQNQILKV